MPRQDTSRTALQQFRFFVSEIPISQGTLIRLAPTLAAASTGTLKYINLKSLPSPYSY